jgi:hypothetical protein
MYIDLADIGLLHLNNPNDLSNRCDKDLPNLVAQYAQPIIKYHSLLTDIVLHYYTIFYV